MNVFECYLKTCDKKLEESIKYFYVTEENRTTIEGKYHNLLINYEPNIINNNIMYDCFVKHCERATL